MFVSGEPDRVLTRQHVVKKKACSLEIDKADWAVTADRMVEGDGDVGDVGDDDQDEDEDNDCWQRKE